MRAARRKAAHRSAIALAAAVWIAASPALADDPRDAARLLGAAGQADAAAIARDGALPATVPGFAGTALPETTLDPATLPDAARTRLADPGDLGGAAGRLVVEGATTRTTVPASETGPVAVRADAVAAQPQTPAFGAAGLASGTARACGAGLGDADAGGTCGGVTYCVGAGCETVESEANAGFLDAATKLNMVMELGGEEFDRHELRFFAGERRACRIRWGGLANCCRNSGLLVGLAGCTEAERRLATERHAGNTHYLGTRCARRVFGVCLRRERVWCVFGSKLGRILHEQARPALGIGWGSCRGFTVAEVERIDFASLDLSEFADDLLDAGRAPAVTLPDANGTEAVLRTRIEAFYRREQ